MAVQKSRKSRATRGHRRAHDKLNSSALSIDNETGELHQRHHITPNGWYRGRQILASKTVGSEETEE